MRNDTTCRPNRKTGLDSLCLLATIGRARGVQPLGGRHRHPSLRTKRKQGIGRWYRGENNVWISSCRSFILRNWNVGATVNFNLVSKTWWDLILKDIVWGILASEVMSKQVNTSGENSLDKWDKPKGILGHINTGILCPAILTDIESEMRIVLICAQYLKLS
jgi:hypothetical protein